MIQAATQSTAQTATLQNIIIKIYLKLTLATLVWVFVLGVQSFCK